MSKKISETVFYILLFLLPTQLGKHFFFYFSQISGIRSDYLVPTIFLTDILALFLITSEGYKFFRQKKASEKFIKSRFPKLFLAFFLYLFLVTVFVSFSFFPAVYKILKILEFVLLGWAIVNLKPNLKTSLSFLGLSIIYSSLIAWGQFFSQKSIGGLLYFLGERSFYSTTPGIALGSFLGVSFLRPYATFPHPNVFGGYLAVLLPIFYLHLKSERYEKKLNFYVLLTALVFGIISLIFVFSRAAWTVFIIGIVLAEFLKTAKKSRLKKSSSVIVLGLFFALLLSIFAPKAITDIFYLTTGSIKERWDLITSSYSLFLLKPFFGVGLNNSIILQHLYLPKVFNLFIFQPVHNLYLLVLVETGIVGFGLFLFFLYKLLILSINKGSWRFLSVILLLILGLFDHYLFTLQQGQLLFTVIASLVLVL